MAHATLKIDLSHKIKPMKPMHGGGQPPLGYDVDPSTKKLVLNEEEAQAVADMFVEKFDEDSVMLIPGGQPVYYYIISAE